MENSAGLEALRAGLAQVRDLERTIGRLSAGNGNARDLIALRMALEQIPALKRTLKEVGQASRLSPDELRELPEFADDSEDETGMRALLLRELESEIGELPELVELIARAILEEPPLALKEGGLIRDGFDAA